MSIVRVLNLDGGGTRGVITIEFLKRIEKLIAPKKLHEYFDMIAGTSTGSLLAICIAYLKMTAAECEEFYLAFANKVFPPNTAARVSSHSEIGDSSALKSLLQEKLGNRLLNDISHPKVMITSTCQRTRVNELCLFRNYEVEDDIYPAITTASLIDAAMASTAAPIYLRPYTIGSVQFVDGGLEANNPSYIALCQSYRIWPDISKMLIVSLGTGTSQVLLKKSQDYSISTVGSATLSNALHDVTSSEKIHKQLQELLLGPSYQSTTAYFRLQVVLSEKDYTALNATSPEKLRQLQMLTQKYLLSNDPAVIAFNKYDWSS